MPENYPEDNFQRKRLTVVIEGPSAEVDRINADIAGVLGDVAASSDVSVEAYNQPIIPPGPSWVRQSKATYSRGLVLERNYHSPTGIAPELYTWVEDPEIGEWVAVISSGNMVAFGAEKMQSADSAEVAHSRYHRFFSRVANYHRYHAAKDENYVLFDEPKNPGNRHLPVPGIRVNGSLELLRKLKTGGIGDYKMSTQQRGIRGVGPITIGSFEEYLEELFPAVDISLATSELDLDLLDRMLRRSEKRGKVWSWVVEQAVGTAFTITGGYRSNLPPSGSRLYLINLQALGLIDRRPTDSYAMSPHPQYYPFVKLQDSRWEDLRNLLIEHSAMPEAA